MLPDFGSTILQNADRLAGHALWVESNGARGERASLSGEDLHGVDLAGAALSGAELKSCNLSGANLARALLVLTDLSDANLKEADLRGAELSGANLQRANLLGANLRRADLSTVELKSAGGDATGQAWPTNCSEAILTNADVTGADMKGTVLTDADLEGIIGHIPELPPEEEKRSGRGPGSRQGRPGGEWRGG